MNSQEIEIRKRIEEAKKVKADCDIQIAKYDIQLLNLDKQVEETVKEETVKTETGYPISFINQNCGHIPIIEDVLNDGTLVFKRNHKSNYTMFELAVLESNMRTIKGTKIFKKLSELTGIGEYTIRRLTKGIATGKYDELFEKWDKLQDSIIFDEY